MGRMLMALGGVLALAFLFFFAGSVRRSSRIPRAREREGPEDWDEEWIVTEEERKKPRKKSVKGSRPLARILEFPRRSSAAIK